MPTKVNRKSYELSYKVRNSVRLPTDADNVPVKKF